MKIFAETERLILRELLPTDIEGMFELDSNPIVHKYLGNKPVKTKEEAEKAIQFIREQYKERGVGRWAVIEKSSGDFMGWSGLKLNTGEKESLNGKQDFYDIGYRFIPRYWGKGYATESAKAALDYGFKVKQYETITGIALLDNISSNKVLQKIGLNHIEDFIYEETKASWYELSIEDYKIFKSKERRRRKYILNRETILKQKKVQYQNDKTYREKTKKYYKEKYQINLQYREQTLKNAKNRYHEDEAYRNKTIERAKARYNKNKS
jgi:RimJ/RimL family protein N-acetyltransferase